MTIAITGLGAVTALGSAARETFDRIVRGERGLSELSLFDVGELRTKVVAAIPGVVTSDSRTSEIALRAAREAILDAGLDVRARRVGLVLGGTTSGMFETESILATLLDGGPGRDEALAKMLNHPLSAPTHRLARELGPFAKTRSISSACSSGANALIVGALWLELGLVDAVVCGAADTLCRVTMTGFNALGALDPEGARPFDVSRQGLTLGEAAGIVVLERVSDARHKRVYCTLLGWAMRAEAHHITNPEATGKAPYAAMAGALARAGLSPRDVDWVNAHGTGTPLNDPMETRALARLFGDDLSRVPVSSQKGMIGHTLAAAGAVEAVLSALAIEEGIILPTGGLSKPDPECGLRHVFEAEKIPLGVVLSSSFGFGGMDTALVLGNASRTAPTRAKRSVVVTKAAAVTPEGVFDDVASLPPATKTEASLPPLDPQRGRRLDRASQIAAVACERLAPDAASGVVLGIAFGAVDGTADFMRRLKEKGPRLVRPADFPSLVPSSPAGHVSIYLGLTGPAMVVADLACSGEAAVEQAWELVAAGEADAMCAGAVEEKSVIVDAALAQLFGARAGGTRREGGVALALEAGDTGVTIEWLDELPDPPAGAIVVLGSTRASVEGTAWAALPRTVCADAAGEHEGVGALAIAVAVAKVARGEASAALFVGTERSYAGVVRRSGS